MSNIDDIPKEIISCVEPESRILDRVLWFENEYSHFARAKTEPAMVLLPFGFSPHLRFRDRQISGFQ